MYKEVDEFLESLSKKFKSLRSGLLMNIFEDEYTVISHYDRENGMVEEHLFINFKLSEEVCNGLSEKGFFFGIFDPKERSKKYPWVYDDINLPKVYLYVFPLLKDENLGLIALLFEEENSLFELERFIQEKAVRILKTIRKIREENTIDEFIKSSSQSIVKLLRNFDSYTYHHSMRVADLSYILALDLRLDSPERLEYAGLIHDVGKLFVSKDILLKKGKLTDEEYEEIKKHVYMLDYLFSGNIFMKPIVEIARLHHERLDGSGYLGISGENLPIEARIICVADVADALLHDRPYRKALDMRETTDILRDMVNKNKLDGNVVEAAAKLLRKFYAGIVKETISSVFTPAKDMVLKKENFKVAKTTIISSKANYVEIDRPKNFELIIGERITAATSVMGVNKFFDAEIISVNENSAVIRIVENKEKKRYVSIPWNLDFYFVKLEKSQEELLSVFEKGKKFSATSTIIGGNGISFKSSKEMEIGDVIVGIFMAYEIKATFIAMIYNKKEIIPSIFEYDAEYLPMPERNVTQIFKLIFRREAALRMGH
jgi:hypothetical protein